MESGQASLSTSQFIGIFRRRSPWIVLSVLVLAGVAYGYSKHEPKKYRTTAALSFNSNQLDQQIAGLSADSIGNALQQQASDLELVKLGDVARTTAQLLGHGLTSEEVSESLSISAPGESGIVEVAATSTSPTLAAAIASTYAEQFVKEQVSTNRAYFDSALALVNKQLAALAPAQRFGTDGLDLQERAHTLGLLAKLKYGDVQLVQEASVPSSPSSPRTKRNTILAAVLGLLLGLGIAVLLERLDRRLREPRDLEGAYGLPLLGVVPHSAALARSARRAASKLSAPSSVDEAFNLIRAQLRFFNIDRDLRTIVIASASQGDGKTTVARHLAEAAARLGSKVLLLEVDLRQPALGQQLGIQSGPGLAGVLIGTISMDDGIQSVPVGGSLDEAPALHMLDVLPAGAPLPPNPGELLASRALDIVLARARSTYDLVVLDTPPLTAVSDAFPLLTQVDGIVIVGRIGHTRRGAVEQLHQVLASSGAPLLGVIANDSKSGAPSPYPVAGASRVSVGPTDGAASSEEFAPAANP
jgi:capsular exopolysaccharide synthesis family protein